MIYFTQCNKIEYVPRVAQPATTRRDFAKNAMTSKHGRKASVVTVQNQRTILPASYVKNAVTSATPVTQCPTLKSHERKCEKTTGAHIMSNTRNGKGRMSGTMLSTDGFDGTKECLIRAKNAVKKVVSMLLIKTTSTPAILTTGSSFVLNVTKNMTLLMGYILIQVKTIISLASQYQKIQKEKLAKRLNEKGLVHNFTRLEFRLP